MPTVPTGLARADSGATVSCGGGVTVARGAHAGTERRNRTSRAPPTRLGRGRGWRRARASGLVVVLGALALWPPAAAGALTYTWDDEIPSLSSLTLTGGQLVDQEVGTIGNSNVNDDRGSGTGWAMQVAGATASVSASPALKLFCATTADAPCNDGSTNAGEYYQGTALRPDTITLPATALRLDSDRGAASSFNPQPPTEGGSNLPTHDCSTPCRIGGNTTAVTIFSAAVGTGLGSFDTVYQPNQLILTVPSTAFATSTIAGLRYKMDLVVTLSDTAP